MDGWDLAMERYRWAVRLLRSGIQGACIPAAKGTQDPRPLPECRAGGMRRPRLPGGPRKARDWGKLRSTLRLAAHSDDGME